MDQELKIQILKELVNNYRFLCVQEQRTAQSSMPSKIAMIYSKNYTIILDLDSEVKVLLIFQFINGVNFEKKNEVMKIKDDIGFEDIKTNGNNVQLSQRITTQEECMSMFNKIFKVLSGYSYGDYLRDNSQLFSKSPNKFIPLESERALTIEEFKELTEEGKMYDNAFADMVNNIIKANKKEIKEIKEMKEENKPEEDKKETEKSELKNETDSDIKNEPDAKNEPDKEKSENKKAEDGKKIVKQTEDADIKNDNKIIKSKLSSIQNIADENKKILKQNNNAAMINLFICLFLLRFL